jgi:hypothetical protein
VLAVLGAAFLPNERSSAGFVGAGAVGGSFDDVVVQLEAAEVVEARTLFGLWEGFYLGPKFERRGGDVAFPINRQAGVEGFEAQSKNMDK